MAYGNFIGDLVLLIQSDQRGVHQVVAFRAGGCDGIADLGGLTLTDQVADGGSCGHDLSCQDTAAAAGMGQQLLTHNRLQAHTQLHTDLGLLHGGEYIHDTVNGIGSGVGMQRCEDQVAGFCGDQRGFDGGKGAHFANQDDIGVFTEDGLQTIGVGTGILSHFALVDDALVGSVDVFDGVFQGDDVLRLGMIDLIQQAGQGGGLTGTGFAGDQDDALVKLGEVGNLVGKTQLFKAGDVVVEDTDGCGNKTLLTEQIDTAAGAIGEADCQILLANVKDLLIVGGEILGYRQR